MVSFNCSFRILVSLDQWLSNIETLHECRQSSVSQGSPFRCSSVYISYCLDRLIISPRNRRRVCRQNVCRWWPTAHLPPAASACARLVGLLTASVYVNKGTSLFPGAGHMSGRHRHSRRWCVAALCLMTDDDAVAICLSVARHISAGQSTRFVKCRDVIMLSVVPWIETLFLIANDAGRNSATFRRQSITRIFCQRSTVDNSICDAGNGVRWLNWFYIFCRKNVHKGH